MMGYIVTEEFIDALVSWRSICDIDAMYYEEDTYLRVSDLKKLPAVVTKWWLGAPTPIESNNRLIAIVKWLNGKEPFDVVPIHMFIV